MAVLTKSVTFFLNFLAHLTTDLFQNNFAEEKGGIKSACDLALKMGKPMDVNLLRDLAYLQGSLQKGNVFPDSFKFSSNFYTKEPQISAIGIEL